MENFTAIKHACEITNQLYNKIEKEFNEIEPLKYKLIVKLYRYMCAERKITDSNIAEYADISIATHKRLHCGCYKGKEYPLNKMDLAIVLNVCIGVAPNYELAMLFWFIAGYATDLSLSIEQRAFYEETFKKYSGKPNNFEKENVTIASKEIVERGYLPIVELSKRKRKEK